MVAEVSKFMTDLKYDEAQGTESFLSGTAFHAIVGRLFFSLSQEIYLH